MIYTAILIVIYEFVRPYDNVKCQKLYVKSMSRNIVCQFFSITQVAIELLLGY